MLGLHFRLITGSAGVSDRPMSSLARLGLIERELAGDDYPQIRDALANWWGGLGGDDGADHRMALVPRLFFDHFSNSSVLIERHGEMVGFLVGFLSQTHRDTAYIHFVGVRPTERGEGLGAALYQWFFEFASANGRSAVRSITSPGNHASIAFHRALGFDLEPGELIDGVPVQRDYDGAGNHRVAFLRHLVID